ncbi:uncharacterized protein UBRO_20832 [Ustilago bromivora]|uniref:Glycosyl hydrolase family 13 catalytic domain-containing protein n=1 Tax=Ustilago bromivora TaxID=307758 RepID=A0A1K0G9E7_9BASI|nr:uncharacterized protein UBRO_20832 [Ustilago bromivora]
MPSQIFDKDTIEFWLEKGINLYSKPMDFADTRITDPNEEWQIGDSVLRKGPSTCRRWEPSLQSTASTPDINDVVRYISASRNKLSQIFQFDIFKLGRDDNDFYANHSFTLKELNENHDLPRAVNKCASEKPEFLSASAKLWALTKVGLTGTLYIYQGQEIGMTNLPTSWSHEDDIAINYYRDAVTRSGGDEKVLKKTLLGINKEGRDNACTPVQWSAESDGGFSTDPKRIPCKLGPWEGRMYIYQP